MQSMDSFALPVQKPFDWESFACVSAVPRYSGVETIYGLRVYTTVTIGINAANAFRDFDRPSASLPSRVFGR
jgi:hypothetical protein